MARLQPYDPYSKRVLPDEFVSPAWSVLEPSVTSSAPVTAGPIDGGEEVFDLFEDGLLTDDGLYVLVDDFFSYLQFD